MIGRDDFYWVGNKLFLKKEEFVELIPHELYTKMWHLKFRWRDEKTPEFFNLVNARENARLYAAQNARGEP